MAPRRLLQTGYPVRGPARGHKFFLTLLVSLTSSPGGVLLSASTLLRRLARRSLKPFVMVALAMTLALSLTVTTTQRAEATPGVAVAPVIAAAEGVLAGGVRLALPSLLSIAIATTPVGWVVAGGLAIGALGVGLYSTKDYWLPFVTGAFGDATNLPAKVPESNAPGPDYFDNLTISSVTFPYPGSPRAVGITLSYPTVISGNFAVGAVLSCKRADGSVYQTTASVGMGISAAKTVTNYVQCPVSGETLMGYRLGALGAGQDLPPRQTTGTNSWPGPTNVWQGGTLKVGAFDPKGGDVKYKTTAECIDDGGNKTSISAEWFGDEGGAKVPSCAAAGKGHNTGKIGIEGYAPTAPGVPGTVPQPVWERTAPTTDPDHPLCGPQRPGPGCEMKITIDGKPCTIGAWECENWTEIWKDPTTSPRVGCTYGPYTLAVDLCTVMEPAYRPGGAPSTEENMDGEPATRNYTQPGGTTYAPPSTGSGAAPSGFPTGGTNPEDPCLKREWSWNPADFVKNPIICGLQDVFVPKMDITARADALATQASQVVPISWLANPITGPSGGGCPNWTINVQGLSKNVVCESSFTSALTGVRAPLFGLVAAAMVWPLLRGIWYASIPVLRVSPGGSR